jgi:hypothetical protein
MTTDQRIENLEKGLASARRFSRWLLAAVGLALGVWILAGTFGPTMAAAPGGAGTVKEIRANRFVIEDENGKTRAVLTTTKDGPMLALFDTNGKLRARLTASNDEPKLVMFDENGKGRAMLHLFKNEPALSLLDEKEQERVVLTAFESGPALMLSGN